MPNHLWKISGFAVGIILMAGLAYGVVYFGSGSSSSESSPAKTSSSGFEPYGGPTPSSASKSGQPNSQSESEGSGNEKTESNSEVMVLEHSQANPSSGDRPEEPSAASAGTHSTDSEKVVAVNPDDSDKHKGRDSSENKPKPSKVKKLKKVAKKAAEKHGADTVKGKLEQIKAVEKHLSMPVKPSHILGDHSAQSLKEMVPDDIDEKHPLGGESLDTSGPAKEGREEARQLPKPVPVEKIVRQQKKNK